MKRDALLARVREIVAERVPDPGSGQTAQRHQRLLEVGREDLSLARLVEAHWDAVAILAEVGRKPEHGAIYGVWAAEAPDAGLEMVGGALYGSKPFCSGAGMIDRALVTVKEPQPWLVDIDLRDRGDALVFDDSAWKTSAFAETKTSSATLHTLVTKETELIGESGYYLRRPGFWHGACGPAACWAGGAAGLVDWAEKQKRADPHTLAHLGAMKAAVWSMEACLERAGREIDRDWNDIGAAQTRAFIVRHIVEQGCTDVIRRLARAYGPHPLAMNEQIARRYQELDLYIRQSHAERDLEALGLLIRGRL